ncbi:MAG TPA: hypothetical protein VLM85_03150 [Polyangiaceae bacterium]|nr:hypothetical protein [Polyangiaceae bacterium]
MGASTGRAILAIAAALLLVIVAMGASRLLGRVSASRAQIVSSFAGGVSLSFVLLELFVELLEGSSEEVHHILRAGPEPVHTIALLMLAGAAATFAGHVYVERYAERPHGYLLVLTPNTAYSALVGAALVEEAHESVRGFVVFWLAMAIHLGIVHHRFAKEFPSEVGHARGVLAASLLAGAIVWAVVGPPVGVFHLLLAVVAGSTLLGIFREEIPAPQYARVPAFLAGVAVFGAIIQLRWRM